MRVPVPSLGLPQLAPRIEAALDAVVSLERSLRTLPESIDLLRQELRVLTEVRDDMRGMRGVLGGVRGDLHDVIEAVDGLKAEIGRLPPDVSHLRGTVDAMYASVDRIEGQVEGLGGSLAQIDRIAGRVVNPLRRRTRRADGAPVAGEELGEARALVRALDAAPPGHAALPDDPGPA